jgi:hypothetical protein
LKNYIGVHSARLEEHLEQLVKWGFISDSKPKKNGVARNISLIKPSNDCMIKLLKIKEAIETINEYFSK